MPKLELRVPPPLVAGIALALMWGIAAALPSWRLALPHATGIAIALAVLGFALEGWGVFVFRRARTTVNPMRPQKTQALVTGGPYRFTRNPMYLGWLPVLAGWALYLGSAPSLVVVPLFVAYLNRFQIEPEERALQQKFGAEFDAYCAGVRRWL